MPVTWHARFGGRRLAKRQDLMARWPSILLPKQGQEGEQFFIHRENLQDGLNYWHEIKHGDRLAVIPRSKLDVDQATPVYEANLFR